MIKNLINDKHKIIITGLPRKRHEKISKDNNDRWDYFKINNYKNTIIEGKFKKKINFNEKKEPKIYNNIKIYPQPDSKRTILPEYGPITIEKNSKKMVDTKAFSQGKKKVQGKRVNNNTNKE